MPFKSERTKVKRLQPSARVAVKHRMFRVLPPGPQLSYLASFILEAWVFGLANEITPSR